MLGKRSTKTGKEAWIDTDEPNWGCLSISLLIVGSFFLVLGIFLPLMESPGDVMRPVFENCGSGANQFDLAACRLSVSEYALNEADTKPNLFALGVEGLRSIGLALIIAVLVSHFVERAAQQQFLRSISSKTRDLGHKVMTGMYNRAHPDSLLEVVRKNILESSFIRDDLTIHYSLSLWHPPAGCDRLAGRKFVKVNVILTASATNVSTVEGRDGDASAPLRLSLPNPLLNELKSDVQLLTFKVNGESFPPEKIAEQNTKLQEQLEKDENLEGKIDLGERTVSKGDVIELSATYTMMKEIEDTEVFRTLTSARKLTLTVVDQTGMGLRVRALATSSGALEEQSSSDGTRQWSLGKMILPQQGLRVWWKLPPPMPPDGDKTA